MDYLLSPSLNSSTPLQWRSFDSSSRFSPSYTIPFHLHHVSGALLYPKTKPSPMSSSNSRNSGVFRCNSSNSDGRNEPDFQVLTAMKSMYNDIVILDTAESRLLLLDSTHNIHSVFNKGQKWTGSYWDEFASLPAIIPRGPIAIFGLGGGTAAHLMLSLWPSLELEGWEIDEILIDKAREYLGLSDLEKHTQDGGILHIRIGDALSTSSAVPGGYAGIVVDLFSEGKVLPPLHEEETWRQLSSKLMPNGRLMVNCGGATDVAPAIVNKPTLPEGSSSDSIWKQNATLQALYVAFPGELSWKKMPESAGENFLALTGPLPDLTAWAAALPEQLSSGLEQWVSC